MRKIVIVGPAPVQILDVTGPLEAFSNAPGYEVCLASPGFERTLKTNRGISLGDAMPVAELRGPIDTLIIAGGPGAENGGFDPSFISWVAEAASRSRRIASICTGAFVLAEAGLLNSRQAVTHWSFCARLAQEYPKVRPENTLPYRRFDGPNLAEAHLPSMLIGQRTSFLVKLKPASLP